jgi:phosphatidylglycerol:prolipoprotein diacylglycerol transferase
MWHYPQIDPVAISLGPIQIHWYALSYLIGISIVWWHFGYRNRASAAAVVVPKSKKKAPKVTAAWTDEDLSDLIFYGVLGVILGGRIGYMLFYGMEQVLATRWRCFESGKAACPFTAVCWVFLSAWFGLAARRVELSFR